VYAIIEDSGTQIKVAEGDVVDIDVRDLDGAESLTFDRVLLLADTGGEPTVGTPYIDGATVTADVVDEIKGNKIDVIKFKRRKGYRRKQGHRQRYLRIRVKDITS